MLPFLRRISLAVICPVVIVSILSGCAGKPKKTALPPGRPPVIKPTYDYMETGIASWYGHPYHGRKTANGEIYDMYKLSAAHRTLPLGTQVYVTNLENGKRVKVRINDRGPFILGRIIDMSYKGAMDLGFAREGLAQVSITLAQPVSQPLFTGNRFAIQVGAFIIRENAYNLKLKLERVYHDVYIEQYYEFYRVRIGGYLTLGQAEKLAHRLAGEGFFPFIISQN